MKWKLGQRGARAAVVGSMVAGSVMLANGSAHAASQVTLTTSYCQAIVKIETHSFPNGLHDAQAIDPTRIVYNGVCDFRLINNGSVIYDSANQPNPAAQSPWEYDGPGNSMYGEIIDSITGERPTSPPN
ncbi:hypothetical protein ACIOJE_20395 [Kitasatospora sp. NPDC087861]|uniref:hypothetical protein n=1 Tax=Kitasatospora sp. NPDC087861 TaxID=3364070 RepID=UPI00381AAD4C